MARIHVLNEATIGKIAAGEVVERPAAAIKELIENSLDAGATSVTVEITDGGMGMFRVSDNGCGIDESDIRLAFERHATSKIRTETDLDSVSTLGFRGEALASIAAVGKVTMITRTQGTDTGLEIQNNGGVILSIREKPCAIGTTIIVKEIFFNTPVRKGFMKKTSVETGAVTDLVSRMILSRPDVSFRFISNGNRIFQSVGDGNLLTAVMTVFGRHASLTMRKVEGHGNGIIVHGYVGVGENARGNRNNELFFINQRVMQSPLLSKALENACRERVMIGKFPVCAIHIKISYEAVDVNVHPNKLTVRFRDEEAVSEALMMLIRDALRDEDAFEHPVDMHLTGRKPSRPEDPIGIAVRPPQGERQESPPLVTTSKTIPKATDRDRTAKLESVALPDLVQTDESPATGSQVLSEPPASARWRMDPAEASLSEPFPVRPSSLPPEENSCQVVLDLEKEIPLNLHGALFNTYIMIEKDDQLLLIDQHAVHERLLFDRFVSSCDQGNAGQILLIPLIISLTKKELAVVFDNLDILEGIGFSIEPFGENEIAVRTVPVILGNAQSETFLRDAVAEIENGRIPGKDKRREALLQLACKHAVKGGEPLTDDVLRWIVSEMLEKKVTPTCPHGRPLVISISRRELDRKFKRIQ